VLNWYSTYHIDREAILLLSRDQQGALGGLLTLALSAKRGLTVAGGGQAEYQVWLCEAGHSEIFPAGVLRHVRRNFPAHGLRFRYLPPATPIAWLGDRKLGLRHLLRSHSRPLVSLEDGSDIAASLAKANNKSKRRRLEKLGQLRFVKITEPAELASCFDEIIRFYDLRRLAVDGICPFQLDPQKKSFYLALAAVPNFLHVTLMRVGDQIASAHIGACGGNDVQLGLIAHNPLLARHSPGKLHLLLLAQMLRAEGFERLDLTPGGDQYKERFANVADEVHTLRLFASRIDHLKGTLTAAAEMSARAILSRCGMNPKQVKAMVSRARHAGPLGVLRGLLSGRANHSAAQTAPGSVATVQLHQDCLDDLLKYRPANGDESRQQFVADALRRIEKGEHFHTQTDGTNLLSIEFKKSGTSRGHVDA
jgi:CelD/BcsL family acetyltransferase involved in cellulose biosynthesis